MNCNRRSTRLILPSLILTAALAGCVSVPASQPAPQITVKTVPTYVLPDPPPAVVDALEMAGKNDASAATWVIALDKFYQKQDAALAIKP